MTKTNERTAYEQWQHHRAQNAMIGSIFYEANREAIEASRPPEDGDAPQQVEPQLDAHPPKGANAYETWKLRQAQHPTLAALYYVQHAAEIERLRPEEEDR